jgi:hypothetical protein
VLDERRDASVVLEVELVFAARTLVRQADAHAAREERQLAQPARQGVERELGRAEHLGVGLEALRRAVARRRFADLDRLRDVAALEAHAVHVAVAADLGLEPLGERVDDRHADAVQAARDLVRRLVELPARVQHRHHDFDRVLPAAVHADRDAAAVVDDLAAPVRVERDRDVPAAARHRLVDRVVHDLVDQVVKTLRRRVRDVHARPLAHGREPLEDLDLLLAVARNVRVVG